MQNTPGFNCRISIRIKADTNGRLRAIYWSRRAMRWLPIKIADAELFLATGAADAAS